MQLTFFKHRLIQWGGIYIGLLASLGACRQPVAEPPLFELLDAQQTGIDFSNDLSYTETFNPYTYRNFYNGGGVGIGDVNNDGLPDVFFCGNLVDNKLYLNQGNFSFRDITQAAGVASKGVWSSGVAMADVNGDGWLDIYVCKSGDPSGERRYNELFINNGLGPDSSISFTERAREFGIADLGLSTHGAFFDYDRDGDLDLYLLNNSIRSVGGYDLRPGQREIPDPKGGNKLYRNENGQTFTDVTAQAGIYSSNIGFGLGVTIGDVDRDGWPDIYVSNDFFERDYLYLNQRNGRFREALEEHLREISLSSMGADMADLNNDGYPEIFVTDMLPADDARMKTKTTFENWDKYQLNVRNGYYRQFTRNVLQLNNGPAPDGSGVFFSEIGRMAGVYATDWSWGALIADLDNDGWKDIFVANGIFKDLTDQDYINFYSDPKVVKEILSRDKAVIRRMIDTIPSQPLPNAVFQHSGEAGIPRFTDRAAAWGLGQPGFSNGSAYGDLDNDGDLDLVVNNVNMPAFVYRNRSREQFPERHFVRIVLEGEGLNRFGLGAQVTLKAGGRSFYQELAPMRGFESCTDSRLLFGLGLVTSIDTLLVRWPDGRQTLRTGVAVDREWRLLQKEAEPAAAEQVQPLTSQPILEPLASGIDFRHRENDFIDFDRDRLLYYMFSTLGPRACAGDVNGDGLEDVFIGGAKDMPGALFLQQAGAGFLRGNDAAFVADQLSEDTDCSFFDADGDGDLDLYVASGGNEFPNISTALIDRLYLNDGTGNFSRSTGLPTTLKFESTGCVRPADVDGDGDMDLFVGIRLEPFEYGVPVNGYLYLNDGKGQFRDGAAELAPDLQRIGMITDAQWADFDGDGDLDLAISGDWMPLTLFRNDNGRFAKTTLEGTAGFWNCLEVADVNADGLPDLIAGNHGLNTRLKADVQRPVEMYVNDFDQNGTVEQIITIYNGEGAYPLILRHDLIRQLPALKKKYLKYEAYREQTISDMFEPAQLEGAVQLSAVETRSVVAINEGKGRFRLSPLPSEAQLAPIFGLSAGDFDGDGKLDILLGGNFYRAKPEVGIHDASYGLLLRGDGAGNFTAVPALRSGFWVKGEVRDIQLVKSPEKTLVLVLRNDDTPLLYRFAAYPNPKGLGKR